ncbi:unnamed protein product [Rhizophagus irregularis]|uniref:Uncharacterized protein n=1 Tax=Rhizophagus irregularis TaxID=588596 RepID=A0A915ZVM8_9GLOM|nr:unnamed protein product [Rhizophagus irregularis]
MIIFLLPKSSKKFLSDNIPEFSLTEISYDKPLFNYISFFTQISPDLISSISQSLVNSKGYNDEKWIAEKYENKFI